ncbi:MAG TPA: phosphatase PAP2 family protein [Miltoncostaeaceae bacterium]|nr:phosphatase PAP2 family protein [Miltoncostaeaceae bacterium]
MSRRRATQAAPAAACVVVLAGLTAVLYAAMVGTAAGRRLEALARFSGAWRNDTARHAGNALLHAVVPLAVAAAVVIVIWTARNRRRREGWAALALLAVANVAAQALKPVLERTDPTGGEALRATAGAFPSGHAALAGSAALAVAMIAPPRGRLAVVVAGAVLVTAVDLSLLAMGWHYPSDIVAGGLIALAAALAVQPGWARLSARAALGGMLVAFAVGLLAGAALAGARPGRDGALTLGAIAVAAVPLGTMLGLSGRPSRPEAAPAREPQPTARYPTATPSP